MLRIVIVDGEPKIVEKMIYLISRNVGDKCKVVGVAYDGIEGQKLVINMQPDIVFADIKTPRISGLEMIEHLKFIGYDPAFVILSGYKNFDYVSESIRLGVDDFLTKPIDEEELKNTILRLNDTIKQKNNAQEIYDVGNVLSEKDIRCLENLVDKLDEPSYEIRIRETFGEIRNRNKLDFELDPEILKQLAMNFLLACIQKNGSTQARMNQYFVKHIFALTNLERFSDMKQVENWAINMVKGINETMIREEYGEKKDVIEQAKEYIRKNFNKNITLNDIAQQFYINPSYFSQAFKKRTGIKYQDYITYLRVSKAKSLLIDTNMKIYEICLEVGYTDMNHFNIIFERLTGKRPGAYRRQYSTQICYN